MFKRKKLQDYVYKDFEDNLCKPANLICLMLVGGEDVKTPSRHLCSG